LYDISWTNPVLNSSVDDYTRLDDWSEWEYQPRRDPPAYKAYCVGRKLEGPVGNNPAVVSLLNEPLVGKLLPEQRTMTYTITVSNLQKQVQKARVEMHWSFQKTPTAQWNIPEAQPRR
jgi:hypothetical protein